MDSQIDALNRDDDPYRNYPKIYRELDADLTRRPFGTEKLFIGDYADPAVFDQELKRIFAKSWLMVGRVSDVEKPGQHIVFEFEALSASVIVLRNKQNVLRAFHNACTHRASKLLNAGTGNCKYISCPFHGWVFDLDGKLVDVPLDFMFDSLDRADSALRPVHVDSWGGFVFINLSEEAPVPLADYLAPLLPALGAYLGDQPWYWQKGYRTQLRTNWKLLVEAQQEGYHVDILHGRTIAGGVTTIGTPPRAYPESLGVPGGCSVYRTEFDKGGVQTPLALAAAGLGAGSLYTSSDVVQTVKPEFEGAIPTDPMWVFDNYMLFPNVVLFVQNGYMFIQRVWPTSVGETTWEVDFFSTIKGDTFGDAFNLEQAILQVRDVLTEDLVTVEGAYGNIKSGVSTHMQLNDMELAVRAFYHHVKGAMA